MDGWSDGCMYEWMDGYMDIRREGLWGWMAGWLVVWMDGWLQGFTDSEDQTRSGESEDGVVDGEHRLVNE